MLDLAGVPVNLKRMPTEDQADISLEHVTKTYPNGYKALRGLNLRALAGQWLVLVGPSGCGKTTTLRIIAGLEEPCSGMVRIAGQLVNQTPPWKRRVAMVFQRPALAPTHTVGQNLTFGMASGEGHEINSIAEILGLTSLLDRLPHQLSGGQQQRVALGRALARRVPIYLLDEPLGQLDAPLRDELRRELLSWRRQHPATVLSVTHDPREAWALGQSVAVIADGAVVQVGTPTEVYRQPCNRFVAAFFAQEPMNFFEVRLRNQQNSLQWTASDWPEPIPCSPGDTWPAEATLGLRAGHVKIGAGPPMDIAMVESTPRGCWVTGAVDGRRVTGWSEHQMTVGERVGMTIDWSQAYVFDRVTGVTLHAPRG